MDQYFIRVCPTTHNILGRVRAQTDDNCIEVSEELFGRILGGMQAFEFVPETHTIELRADYEAQPVQELDAETIQRYNGEIEQLFNVPELDIDITIGGTFGAALLMALSCAQYCPQTILCTSGGKFKTIEIEAEAASQIAKAYQNYSRILLGVTELGDSDEQAN
ncbi:tail fiber protein [Yersinia phage fHe-Yen9-02]|nr:tail fiber protein [Yersinia phage fHe-Yen9-02]